MAQDNEVSSISHSRALEEMAEFWDAHDATDFDDQTHEVDMEFDLRTRRHYIAIDPDVLARLREAVTARGVSIESRSQPLVAGTRIEVNRRCTGDG